MARTFNSILKNSRGRFLAIRVSNSKISDQTVVGKVVNISRDYVTVQAFANIGYKGGFETSRRTRKFHKNSIQHVAG